MNLKNEDYISCLQQKGYCIIPNVLNEEEILTAKKLFFEWKQKIPNIDKIHELIDPHGIFKYHQIGHQEHAWYLRTNPKIINIFKKIWNCDDLVSSFDGCCYIKKDINKKDNIWTHTDQPSNNSNLICYQSFVTLTDNKERTLVVYENSHNFHMEYFKDKPKSGKRWNLIDHEVLELLKESKKILEVSKGSLVIWDSRTFHQNQYGQIPEERLVQYLCYLPKHHKDNTKAEQEKRLKYFNDRRTTSHWPYKINVNSLQPQTYGNNNRKIDYSLLPEINLEKYINNIKELI